MQDKKFPQPKAAAGQLGRVTPVIVDYREICNIAVYFRDELAERALERRSEPTVIALGRGRMCTSCSVRWNAAGLNRRPVRCSERRVLS